MKPAAIGLSILAWLLAPVGAQTAQPDLSFDVASVRPSGARPPDAAEETAADAPSGQLGGPGTSDPERIFYFRVPLQRLLMNAYQVQADQISAPVWLASEKFDITAIVRKGATQQQVNVMLQNLLVERFKLALHHATKPGPVYELRVAPGGLKMKQAPPEERTAVQASKVNGVQRRTCRACSIQNLIEAVQGFSVDRLAPDRILDKTGLDQTGLSGKYDFTLEYSVSAAGGALKLSALQSQAHMGQDVFSAFEKQLGLKLDKGRAAVDFLIVDRIEKVPTEN